MRRRPRQSWATMTLPPVTVDELDRHLDSVAILMSRLGRDAHRLLPIWERFKAEKEKCARDEAMLAEARQWLTRSPDRTAAPA